MASSWHVLTDVLILLAAALVAGTIAQQLKQNALLGYLVAGTLVGPNCIGWVGEAESVNVIAELGVALLLFTIGLEFSFKRLRQIGHIALIGGSLQVIITMATATLIASLFGQGFRASVAIGAMIALSSTACVLRILVERSAVDSVHGRSAVGILLLQDVAVIPLVLIVVTMVDGDTPEKAVKVLLGTGALAAMLIGSFYILFNQVVPRLFMLRKWAGDRELPILLAVLMALGSAAAAHAAGVSPAIGAFCAGVLLGESPFAVQIRADVGSLRTVLMTLFFASIGMLGDPAWAIEHGLQVGGLVAAILIGKTLIVFAITRMLGLNRGLALAAGLTIAQVGEFSFVLGGIASAGDLLTPEAMQVLMSAMLITLFLTPFLIAAAPRAAERFHSGAIHSAEDADDGDHGRNNRIFIIGFGPAGQSVAAALHQQSDHTAVLDLNPRNVTVAHRYDLHVFVGDATHRDVLEHAGISSAEVIVITVPDPAACRTIIAHCRSIAPEAATVVRSRYHVHRWELQMAGAREVIDEEEQVGLRLAAVARRYCRDTS